MLYSPRVQFLENEQWILLFASIQYSIIESLSNNLNFGFIRQWFQSGMHNEVFLFFIYAD